MAAPLRVLYNSVCLVCREGICMFERRTRESTDAVKYVDVSADRAAFLAQGITLDDVRFKLHAITPEGEALRGWPAIAALWCVTPGFGWLGYLGSLPGLNLLSAAAYDLTARVLWAVNRAQNRW
ncbi:MAG: DCC1-like thiol-disulfide oxidoreductase family protein [Pseudomonadota bacterium]